MNFLVHKLKRLKGEFKIWEKRQKDVQRKALGDMDEEAQHLFSCYPSGIFADQEMQRLEAVSARNCSRLQEEQANTISKIK